MDDAVRDQEAFEIEFEPVGRRGPALPGETLLSVAQSAGVELVAVCGGAGVCGTCRVRWLSGDFTPPGMDEEGVLEDGEIEEGWRLACRASVVSSAVVEIPPESMATVQRLQLEGRVVADGLDPSVEVVAVQVDPPSGKDLRSDWSRLAAALQSAGMPVGRCRLSVARSCSTRVRTNGWHARVVVDTVAEPAEVVAILGGDERAMGLAVDIGTTKIAAYLVDLESGDTVARSGVMNPQIAYGEDVVSRIAYANQGSEQASTLQTRLADAVQSLAADLCDTAGVTPSEIVDCVIVENTAIHHLLTGLSVRQLGEAPYVPVVSSAMSVTAVEVGLSLAPGAHIYLPPNVAGYVGADHVSMLLATDLESIVGVVLAIDIGTNTEISLRVDDRILTCSCASGPAFEGAHIRDGMRAVPGAVERVHAAGDTIHIHTVGDQPPVGICGSGILDAVAVMLDNGIINDRGGLRVDHPGVKIVGTERQFVLVRAEDTGHGSDVVVTRADVHEIQLAKGAIRAGIEVLLHEASLTSAAIDSFVVAGAFGTYLDVESAKRIGMFPDVSKERFHQVGNAAGMGAIQMLRSRTARRSVESLVRGIEYIELTTHPHFSDLFTQALFFHCSDSPPEASDTDTRENASFATSTTRLES